MDLIEKYRSKGLMIDTNLLLLFFIGTCKRDLISDFKRTMIYMVEDFLLIQRLIASFKRIVVTQSILTEVSDLMNQLKEHQKVGCYNVFAKSLKVLEEEYVSSKELVVLDSFSTYGLADTGIISQSAGKYLVLTDDLRLSGYLQKQKVDVVNFNHIRQMAWKSGERLQLPW